jgi:hypothetical protein
VDETSLGGDVVPLNNLFFGNTVTDFRDENLTSYSGANAINLSVIGASGNVTDPPVCGGASHP